MASAMVDEQDVAAAAILKTRRMQRWSGKAEFSVRAERCYVG